MKKNQSVSKLLAFVMAPLTILIGITLLLFQAFSGSFFNPDPQSINSPSSTSSPQEEISSSKKEKGFFQVKNDLLGIEFQVPPQFQQLSRQEIEKQNPNFIYGFQLANNQQIKCFISRTARTNPQPVNWEYLAQGTFQEIQKSFPEAKLENVREVKFSPDNSGAALKITYPDPQAENQTVLQWEVVGVNQSSAFFAFCQAPAKITSNDKNLLGDFLGSFKIYQTKSNS
jgi:hypothetical protein